MYIYLYIHNIFTIFTLNSKTFAFRKQNHQVLEYWRTWDPSKK